MGFDILQMLILLVIVFLLVRPVGTYMAAVFMRKPSAVDRVFDHFHNEQLADDWPAGREHVVNGYRDLPFDFAPIKVPPFEMRCHWTLAQYLAYLRSWSASQRYQQRTGRDAVEVIGDAMNKAWGTPSTARTVSWPLTILAGRRQLDRLRDPTSAG